MFRQTKYSSPNGRGKKGRKLAAGGSITYQGANQDAVSPQKLQQLIKTFAGFQKRPNFAAMYGRDQVWGDQPIQRKAAGGLIDRSVGPNMAPWVSKKDFAKGGSFPPGVMKMSNAGWNGMTKFFFGDGGKPDDGKPKKSIWSMDDDIPSSRPGYRSRVFSNASAVPSTSYSKPISKQEFADQSGPFADKKLDFSTSPAAQEFENNPFASQVSLGDWKRPVNNTGQYEIRVNEGYPLLKRYEEYKEPVMSSPTANPMTLGKVQTPPFLVNDGINRVPRKEIAGEWMPTNFTGYNHPTWDTEIRRMGKGKSPGFREDGGLLDEYAKGGWIAKAVNPAHKGYCTPMSKSTCTGRRRAFALTMKKHHGFHAGGGKFLAAGLMVRK